MTEQPNAMQQSKQQPRNIFELINMNIVDMSQDIVSMAGMIQDIYGKVNALYGAFYPPEAPSAPMAPGTAENIE